MNGGKTERARPEADRSAVHHPLPLHIDELTVQRGDFRLGPLSAEVPAGSVTAVVGPSGSGKSTLLRGIMGLEKETGGSLLLGEEELAELSPAERRIGVVFQEAFLYPHMTGGANLGFPLRLRREKRERIKERVREVAEELSLPQEYLPRHLDELPQGIRQLFALGKGRIREFDLLLLDEPFQHLDAAVHRQVRIMVARLVRNLGRTVMLSLTEAEDVLAVSDRTLVLEAGRLVDQGRSAELYRRPASRAAMEMLSPLGLNRVPVQIAGGRVRGLELPAGEAHEGRWELCFRPEDAAPDGPYELPCELERRAAFDGRRDVLEGRVKGQRVIAMWPRETASPVMLPLHSYRLFPAREPDG